jgi:outer membrane protein assembly factor BamE (lipoprotein component of BamABCDE complex)
MFFKSSHHIKFYLSIFFIISVSCKLQEPLKTHGIIYLENRSAKLTVEKSNKNDVIEVMGQPQIRSDEINDSWIYVERVLTKGKYHKLGRHVLKENNVLVLSFNKFGVLAEKKLFSKDDIKKVKFSKKTTQNEISQKSFVESFLQSLKTKMYKNRK